jgi:hypothetical protein
MSKYKILHIGTSEYIKTYNYSKYANFAQYGIYPLDQYTNEKDVIVNTLRDAEQIINKVIKWSNIIMCSEEFDIIEINDE